MRLLLNMSTSNTIKCIWNCNVLLPLKIIDMECINSTISTYDLRMINTLRPRQNGSHFADDIFKCIFLNENVWFRIKISLKFVPKGPINIIPSLVQIMAWRRPGDKPSSEPMMVSLTTHICVTRPQWVKMISWPQIFCQIRSRIPGSMFLHECI